MFYTVANVDARKDFVLFVTFTDGVEMFYDVKPLFEKWPVFNELRSTKGLFQRVKVIADGYAVGWNDRIDLACNELREHGKIPANSERGGVNMLRPTAVDVRPMSNYRLWIRFDNNEQRILDVSPYIKGEWYGRLADESYFSTVKADGYTIAWPDGQDLCPDEVYYMSVPVK